jgi:4-amino-4-deoxy-L-arabinose transferase-like glycosyltransferase
LGAARRGFAYQNASREDGMLHQKTAEWLRRKLRHEREPVAGALDDTHGQDSQGAQMGDSQGVQVGDSQGAQTGEAQSAQGEAQNAQTREAEPPPAQQSPAAATPPGTAGGRVGFAAKLGGVAAGGLRAVRRLPARVRHDPVLLALTLLLAAGLALRVWFTIVWHPALIGYSDSGIYFTDGVKSVWSDPIRTVGYSMFLRVLHGIWPNLLLVTIVQHGLGLLTAVLLFLAVRRCGGPRWLGLIPAAFIALGGDQLFLEHAALSDSLFIFLLTATLYTALRAAQGSAWWAAVAGLCLGLGVWDRGDGLVLAGVIPLWLLFSAGRPSRRTLALGALALAVSLATVGVYVGWRKAASDMPGLLTSNNAYNLYSRVAPWANCTKFTPPAGTGQLCEFAPPGHRLLPARGEPFTKGEAWIYSPESPAVKLAGSPAYLVPNNPRAMQRLEEFSEAAILGQPLEYLHAVWLDTIRLFNPQATSYGDDSANEMVRILLYGTFYTGKNEFVEEWEKDFYPQEDVAHPHHGDVGPLKELERLTRLDGAWLGLLLALCLAGPWLLGGRVRRLLGPDRAGRARGGMVLFGLVALAMLFFPIIVKGYDYRFVIPAYGPLVAAGALAGWGLAIRLRARFRTSPHRRGAHEQRGAQEQGEQPSSAVSGPASLAG